MQTGILFDIQRCSLNDGPGLRTTVFLKGCPLRCLWCHNPESQARKPELMFNYEKCIGCGKCSGICECHSFSGGTHTVDRARCRACGRCVQACPTAALEVKGRLCTVEEVMHEVRKDVRYYRKSGGGMTVSGGEPLQQPEFLKELLKACREEHIHTAVETSGFATKETLEKILPLTDLFLWDYKITDPAGAKDAIGVDNRVMMENLDFVMGCGAKVQLRCPIIPTVSDNRNHLAAIAELSRKYPFEGIDILPYHNMGVFKSRELGRQPWDGDFGNMSDETKAWIGEILRAEGCGQFRIL